MSINRQRNTLALSLAGNSLPRELQTAFTVRQKVQPSTSAKSYRLVGEGVHVVQRASFGGLGLDDQPTCNQPCQNGGSCIFQNLCQCPKTFRGPQCQYSVDRCSIKNTGFNGGFRCSGSASEMVCTISCPEGIDYEFPPADKYSCKFSTGVFTPARIPKCIYGESARSIHESDGMVIFAIS